jgi:hypothetical protein
MDKNQKIALGCGGAGCLGIILVVVVCVILVAAGYMTLPGSGYRNYNANTNSNYNSNLGNSNSNSQRSSSSFSDDDKHKLMQAAAVTQDRALMERVLRKCGFLTGTNTVSDDYPEFLKQHLPWARKNRSFIQSVNTPEKGRAYAEAHIDD